MEECKSVVSPGEDAKEWEAEQNAILLERRRQLNIVDWQQEPIT